jgi:hypothetical protein
MDAKQRPNRGRNSHVLAANWLRTWWWGQEVSFFGQAWFDFAPDVIEEIKEIR